MNLWYRQLQGAFVLSSRKKPRVSRSHPRFKGMSLLEVLVAMGLLAVCLVIMMPIEKSRQQMRQKHLEQKILVDVLEQSWEEIVAGGDLRSEVNVHGVSIQLQLSRETADGLENIHIEATAPSGKTLHIDGTLEVPRFYAP